MASTLCQTLNIDWPLIQAPMAGVSTPQLAAAVSNAGALGSISVGAATPEQAAEMIAKTQLLTRKPFNVNVFCHAPAVRNAGTEAAWIARFSGLFAQYGAELPRQLTEIYQTFLHNAAMLEVLEQARPAVVSFHFGLPDAAVIERLKVRDIVTLASATSPQEAAEIERRGIDVVVAQGYEAGGHRGQFDPEEVDQQLSTFALVQAIRQQSRIPIVAAGGVMDGRGMAAMLKLGAGAVQLGTAFILCPESAAGAAYRTALKQADRSGTEMTAAISGRQARCLRNAFCAFSQGIRAEEIPSYPLTYSLGKALAAAAELQGEPGFGAQWAGQGAALARELPAAELVATLINEWQSA